MPHFSVKDLEKMVTDRLDNRGLNPPSNLIERLRIAGQKLKVQLPKLPKV